MKTKLVIWGTNAQEEKILIAAELKAIDNIVIFYIFSENDVTEEFVNAMMNMWRNNNKVVFPEKHETFERKLTISDGLLPDYIKTERTDIVNRIQTEWHFIVLSNKLKSSFESELSDLKEKVGDLSEFSSDVWEELKGFWDKVQNQVRERNLFREHVDTLKEQTNNLFSEMKKLRKKIDDKFGEKSHESMEFFMGKLNEIEEKITKGMGLQPLFEDLKDLQRKYRDTKFTKEHRNSVWDKLDKTFKKVKEKRFGDGYKGANNKDRLQRRYDGLITAIDKMEKSIGRDRNDLEFETNKIERTNGQLESQIRLAKVKMIEERVRSKSEKLAEMHKTRESLEEKLKKEAEKEERKSGAAKEGDSAKTNFTEKKENSDKNKKKEPVEEKEDSLFEAVSSTIGESFSDVVDTVRAVAEVVGDKVEALIDDITQDENDQNEKGEEE